MKTVYRTINTDLFDDDFMWELSPAGRLLVNFLLVNKKTRETGIYQISIGYMARYIGVSHTEIRDILQQLEKLDVIAYDEKDELMYVKIYQSHKITGRGGAPEFQIWEDDIRSVRHCSEYRVYLADMLSKYSTMLSAAKLGAVTLVAELNLDDYTTEYTMYDIRKTIGPKNCEKYGLEPIVKEDK